MHFTALKDLKINMELARDLHLFDKKSNKVKLLRKGVKLNLDYILKLKDLEIVGVYIKDGIGDDLEIKSLINDMQKVQTIYEIKNIFENCYSGGEPMTTNDVDRLQDIADNLVESVEENKNLRISIGNLKSYDDYTYHHSLSVSVIALAIGTQMGLSFEALKKLGLCALLHDIGKTDISVDIINKPGKLTEEEFIEIKTHPLRGGDYLYARQLIDKEVYEGIISHHEHWDGTGYPFGLKGEEIPLFARIISVADVYDALTSNRPYRMPNTPNDAVEYIMAGAYNQFDFDCVHAFLKRIEPYPIGSCVRLSNGKIGYIINTDDEVPLRPTVKTLDDGTVYDLERNRKLINITILGYYGEFETEVVG